MSWLSTLRTKLWGILSRSSSSYASAAPIGAHRATYGFGETTTLIDQYRQLHEAGKFRGLSLLPHVKLVAGLVKETESKTLLDFGCGKGEQYTKHFCHEAWGIMPTLYDPAVPGLDRKPDLKFDGVICSDVLEHLPESQLPAALDEIFGYARKFVYLSITTRPARKHLPDGRNCHLTVKPPSWWMNLIGLRSISYHVSFL